MVSKIDKKGNTMEERRSCSRIKPWIYFGLELTIFMILGAMVGVFVGGKLALPTAIGFVVAALYKTQAVQRLERVLERTEEVRVARIRQKYQQHI